MHDVEALFGIEHDSHTSPLRVNPVALKVVLGLCALSGISLGDAVRDRVKGVEPQALNGPLMFAGVLLVLWGFAALPNVRDRSLHRIWGWAPPAVLFFFAVVFSLFSFDDFANFVTDVME